MKQSNKILSKLKKIEEQIIWGTNKDGNVLSSLHYTVQETTNFLTQMELASNTHNQSL